MHCATCGVGVGPTLRWASAGSPLRGPPTGSNWMRSQLPASRLLALGWPSLCEIWSYACIRAALCAAQGLLSWHRRCATVGQCCLEDRCFVAYSSGSSASVPHLTICRAAAGRHASCYGACQLHGSCGEGSQLLGLRTKPAVLPVVVLCLRTLYRGYGNQDGVTPLQ